MSLRPRGRHKTPGVPSTTNDDAIRTCLNDLKDSTDLIPPLKSAVDAVLAVWDLANRVSASDEHAEELAWRAVCILDAIYNASGEGAGPVSAAMLDAIRTFVGLLREISAAMEEELKPDRLHLQKSESRLAQFVAWLDFTSEAFKIESSAAVEEQPVPATPDQASELQPIQTVIRISHVSGGTGGSGGIGGEEGGVGGPGNGPSFQAETIMIQNCPPEHERLEQSNIRLDTEVRDLHTKEHVLHTKVRVLRTEVRVLRTKVRVLRAEGRVRDTEVLVLRTVVLFGLSPVSCGYLSGCAGAL